MRWHQALKVWNAHHKSINPAHVFALPRRGTPEHAEVMKIINDSKPAAAKPEAKPEAPKEKGMPKSVAEQFLRDVEERRKLKEAEAPKREAEEAARLVARRARDLKLGEAELKREKKKAKAKAKKQAAKEEAKAEKAESKSQRDKILDILKTEFVGRGRK